MKQFIKEIFVLITIVPVCLVLVFFVMQKAEQSRQVEKLTATVEKKELTLSSPVFGSIESFPLEEGDVVKKGQTIAKIQIIDTKEAATFNSNVYKYDEKTNSIVVKSPTDAVVVKKEFAEKSTIKPQENLVILNPLLNTVIKIEVNEQTDVASFESIALTDKKESYSYPIIFSKRLPVADKEGKVFYFATLTDQKRAKEFYNNEKVVIKARKPAKALTGKLEAAFMNLANQINGTIQNYL